MRSRKRERDYVGNVVDGVRSVSFAGRWFARAVGTRRTLGFSSVRVNFGVGGMGSAAQGGAECPSQSPASEAYRPPRIDGTASLARPVGGDARHRVVGGWGRRWMLRCFPRRPASHYQQGIGFFVSEAKPGFPFAPGFPPSRNQTGGRISFIQSKPQSEPWFQCGRDASVCRAGQRSPVVCFAC